MVDLFLLKIIGTTLLYEEYILLYFEDSLCRSDNK
jgi:hypothetical protein